MAPRRRGRVTPRAKGRKGLAGALYDVMVFPLAWVVE